MISNCGTVVTIRLVFWAEELAKKTSPSLRLLPKKIKVNEAA
ncbi:hypothetical protein ACVBE9_04900 [Eionea flava]